MLRVAYLFERFPSFGQTFCYREVAELVRQGAEVSVFSIRKPEGEPAENWDAQIVRGITYLPAEGELVKEVQHALHKDRLSHQTVRLLKDWDRQSDFLRLYQAVFVGLRLQEQGIRRVHAHFAGMAARTAYWIHRFFGIEFSVTAHANDIFAPRDFAVSLEKIFESAIAVVTVSDFSVAQLRGLFPKHGSKIHRVYNGLEIERFPEAAFGAGTPCILSIGRLIEKKGFGDLIAACALLRDAGREFRCEIIGEGPLESQLSAQIAQLQLQSHVQLLGPRKQEEIRTRLAAASIFVLPCMPDAEGGMDNLPTVIMEAMACGLPVVSTPLAGIPEMVQPEVSGLLVSPRDPVALAAAAGRLITNSAESRAFGRQGREIARERFSIATNVRSLAALLAQI